MNKITEEYIDEFEEKAQKLIKELSKTKHSNNSTICQNVADLYVKSKNPEAKKIYTFFMGMSKFEAGKAEKDPHKAKDLFKASVEILEKENIDLEGNQEFIKEAKILGLKKEIEISSSDISKLPDLFNTLAKLTREDENTEGYNANKGMFHFFKAMSHIEGDPINFLKDIDESLKHLEKVDNKQIIHKLKSIKYRFLINYQPTLEQKLVLLHKQLNEIQLTDDKFGINDCKASIAFINGKIEKNPRGKKKYFNESSELFKKCKNFSGYHVAKGWEFMWTIHNPSLTLDRSIELIKKSISHFKKGDDLIGFNSASGQFHMLKSIKEGLIKRNDKKYVENLVKANNHFSKCKNKKYVNLTAGILLFRLASKMPSDKSKDAYKKAAEILDSINEEMAHLAYSMYYRNEAYKDIHNIDYMTECLKKSTSHLDQWIQNQVKISYTENTIIEILDGPNPKDLISFYQAESYYIKGLSSQESNDVQKNFYNAIEKYDEIIKSGFLVKNALRAKGWSNMFLFKFDDAHNAFDEALKLEPSNKGIKQEVKLSLKYLKDGFRNLQQMLKEEVKFSRSLQRILAKQINYSNNPEIYGPDYEPNQDFYERILKYIQRAGLSVEENHPNHIDKDEESLRDELVQCLKMLNVNVVAEGKKAKGKRDIAIKDYDGNKEFSSECLVWKGPEYYKSKKKQLFDRYLTWHDRQAALVTFVRNKNFDNIVLSAKNIIPELSGIVNNSFQDLSTEKTKLFLTVHTHSSGTNIKLFHIFFHLPIS